jgi:predicted nucleotidyltransferase
MPMLTKEEILRRRDEIIAVADRYGAYDIRLFGSMARGDNIDSSDLDLIVRFQPGRSLLDHGGLVMDLHELLGMRVDVIDDDGMRPRFRLSVLSEAIPL